MLKMIGNRILLANIDLNHATVFNLQDVSGDKSGAAPVPESLQCL